MALRGSDAVPDSHPTGGTHSKRKFSSILAPGDDREFSVLPPKMQRKLEEVFARKSGGAAREHEEVRGKQLSALAARLAVDEAPYTDFSVWGPYGKRALKAASRRAQIFAGGALTHHQVNRGATWIRRLAEVFESLPYKDAQVRRIFGRTARHL